MPSAGEPHPEAETNTACPLDQIDIKTQEIKASSDETYTDVLELADDLPDSSPRFVLLSYPLTLVRLAASSTYPWYWRVPQC